MKHRFLALLAACLLASSGCATTQVERRAPEVAERPVDRLRELLSQHRYYEGFLLWPKVEKALAKTSGRGTLGREYASLIQQAAAGTPDEWRWIMASPQIQRRLKVDLVVEIGAHE